MKTLRIKFNFDLIMFEFRVTPCNVLLARCWDLTSHMLPVLTQFGPDICLCEPLPLGKDLAAKLA